MENGIATLRTVPGGADLRLVLQRQRRDVQARAHRGQRAEDQQVARSRSGRRGSRWRTSGSAHGTAKYIHQHAEREADARDGQQPRRRPSSPPRRGRPR
jgi:hypothetical protein